MELTPEQNAIVLEKETDLVVTAGAGSGKTHVLVERYLKLLNNCQINQIAAVTFTEAAAAEMKERVRRAILERPELADHRSMLDDAVIGTIHSLCRRILRDHPVEASLDPNAQILDEYQAEAAIQSACMDALEYAASTDGLHVRCLRDLGVRSLKEFLPTMVQKRDAVRKAFGKMPGSTIQERAISIKTMLHELRKKRMLLIQEPVNTNINTLQSMFSGDEDDLLWTKFKIAIELMCDASTTDAENYLDGLVSAFARFNLQGGSAKNWNGNVNTAKDLIRNIRETAQAEEKAPQWNEYDEPALMSLESLQLVFEDACTRYQNTKSEIAGVDFLDLEFLVEKLLDSHPEVVAGYHSRFKHVLVDELQDTNPIQVRLIELLTQSPTLKNSTPKRFLVGDIKQAIYRFRGSEISQFRSLMDNVTKNGITHSLSRSFRTHDPLVFILNELFESVFGKAKAPYEVSMESLVGRGGIPPLGPHFTIIPIAKDDDKSASSSPAVRLRRAEAEQIASEIASLLELPRQVWDKSTQTYRSARPSDIAILMRRLQNVHIFERALENHSIPYQTPSGAGFFTRQEVIDLTNLLSWLAEPEDEIALVGVLRSPMFMIDDTSLLKLRYQSKKIMSALSDPPSEFPEEIYKRCVYAADVLKELQEDSSTQPANILLERALSLTNFEASWAPLKNGDQALGNIRKLVRITRQLSDQSNDEVVDYLKARRDELDAKEGLATVDDADAVRLMSVHGAKGLEFPVVFIPESDLHIRPSSEIVRWRSNDGISLTLSPEFDSDLTSRTKPGFYSYLAQLDRQEDAAEYKRLFYVAATRAGDALFLTGDAEASEDSWLSSSWNALDGSTLEGIDLRDTIQANLAQITNRIDMASVNPPSAESEKTLLPPLVIRPNVVPLRSSIPATSLKAPEPEFKFQRSGDRMGLTRGIVTHKAIELWLKERKDPDLHKILQNLGISSEEARVANLVEDVEGMLQIFLRSPLFSTISKEETNAYFELPFSWNWAGIPIHGTIDLVYKINNAWHVIDFKTDQLRKRSIEDASKSYLPQLALYATAIEAATGIKPEAGLFFLRTGDHYNATKAALHQALKETRNRIELGSNLEAPVDEEQLIFIDEI